MKTLARATLIALACGCFALSAGATSYPSTLGHNAHIEYMYGHMGTGFYLDTASVQVRYIAENTYEQHPAPTGVVFSVNTWAGYFNEDNQLQEVQGPAPVWFYYTTDPNMTYTQGVVIDGRLITLPPFVGTHIAYVSYTNGEHWMPFYRNCDLGACKSEVTTFRDASAFLPPAYRPAALRGNAPK